MDIVTNVYMKDEYQVNAFVKKYFPTSLTTPIPHKELANILDNRKLIPAIQQIMGRPWRGINGLACNQKTLIELQDNDFANILLLKSPQGDKLTIMVMGNKKVIDYLIISYVGSDEKFEEYLKVLNIPSLTIYSNVILNPE